MARLLGAAAAALVVVTAALAGGSVLRVGLSATGGGSLDVGAATKLTASARLPRGDHLLIQAFLDGGTKGTKLAECLRSPCSATYKATDEEDVDFQASVIKHVGRKVTTLGHSARVSVFWSEPPPPPPPPPAAVPGHYEGHTQDNELFDFDVSADGLEITGLQTGQINQSCDPPDFYLFAGDLTGWSGPVAADGTFSFNGGGPTTVGTDPATNTIAITGTVANSMASGTIHVVTDWTHDGTSYVCTNGVQTWTAAKV